MKKNNVKDAVLMIAFAGLVSVNCATAYNSYKVASKNAEVKEPVEEIDDKEAINTFREEQRIAYYIQKSGIKMNGAITKPQYFGKLPDDYKNLLIMIKDFNKEDLSYYLKMNVGKDEALVFERELADLKKPEFIEASYQR
ncbi:hypothetical protein HDR59_01690 [bacterium]|nr:hypothetical protein [bacterium]